MNAVHDGIETAIIEDGTAVNTAIAFHARHAPDRVALEWGGHQLTYRELNARALAVAARLRAAGVGPEVVVALAAQRSFDLVVGLLGILHAGGAYLPLDPEHPEARLAYILEDSQAALLLTDRAVRQRVPGSGLPTILLDDFDVPEDESSTPASNHPDSLAYVIYTSGSTGQPKGVAVSHGSLTNFLDSMRRRPGFSAGDVLLAVTTLSFDIAALELLLPLTTGGKVVLAPKEAAMDGAALCRALADHGVTMMQATPSTWRLLRIAGWEGSRQLKALCGGEAMPPALARQLLPRCRQLWNMYGPTETTIWSTCARITSADDIHVGRPIEHTSIHILRDAEEWAAAGETGEIVIGGAGVARGYLHRPALTRERFINRPGIDGPLYRTGDLGRIRPDGNLECLGRLDHQVKVRGHRIELGEIENLLGEHPEIDGAVVVAHGGPDDARLVAYYRPRDVSAPPAHELRKFLGCVLPEYMLPGAFVPLAAFPVTPNGKIDRQALPAPSPAHFVSGRPIRRPQDALEEDLLRLFTVILGHPVESTEDSFFDLGGTSLQAAVLVAEVEKKFGVQLPLAQLLQVATIAGIARLVAAPAAAAKATALVPIRPRPGRPTLFLVHGAGGNVLLYRELADALAPDVSVFGFQCTAGAEAVTTIEQMASAYVRELKIAQPAGPYFIGGYCMGGTVALEMARQLRAGGDTVGLVALLDTYNFHLARAHLRQTSRLTRAAQKVRFHLANLSALSWRDQARYVSEKARLALERAWHWVRRGRRPHPVSAPAWSGSVTQRNEEAAWTHTPSTYQGPVAVFAPARNYRHYPDPHLGWSGVVTAGLEVIPVPCNPHALLTRPWVGQVARELRRRVVNPLNRDLPPAPGNPGKTPRMPNKVSIAADAQAISHISVLPTVPPRSF